VHHHRLALALRHRHRHDLVVEAPLLERGGRAPVRLQGERVLVLARHPVALGHVLGRLAHRLGRVALGHARIHEPPTQRGVLDQRSTARKPALGLRHNERSPRHALDTPTQQQFPLADQHGSSCLRNRLKPRRTQPIDRGPRNLNGEPGQQKPHPRHVPVVLTGLVRAPEEHVVDRVHGQ
jgi:hypothetical protein